MSTVPIAEMTRRVLQNADGTVSYQVVVQITDQGILPFPELFILTISDPLSVQTDVFAQVVTPFNLQEIVGVLYVEVDSSSLKYISGDAFAAVADITTLTTLPRDRITAVRTGATQYLTSVVSLSYPDVTTATAAYQTILARLSTLVTDWQTYAIGFVTTPVTDYPLPQVGVGVEDQLTAAFTTAQTATSTAAAARDSLQTQVNTCNQTSAANAAIFAMLTSDIAFLQAAKNVVIGTAETVSGLGIQANPGNTISISQTSPSIGYSFLGTSSRNVGAFVINGSNPQSYQTLLNQKLAAWNALSATITAQNATCNQLTRQLADAQIAVASAQAAQNAALANLLAVCPNYTPAPTPM